MSKNVLEEDEDHSSDINDASSGNVEMLQSMSNAECPSKEIQEDLASSSSSGQRSLLKKDSPMRNLHDLISHNISDEKRMPLTKITDDNGELVDNEMKRLSPVKMADVSPKSVAKGGKKGTVQFYSFQELPAEAKGILLVDKVQLPSFKFKVWQTREPY
ncbi:hypothetical protein K7X08_027787 [Anisodus acutangulus]|uniref:Uncharacterized protein n=1 Tax=Anisodus acutangulus TaxID=402998 RepID=A0A9Q1LMD8_9SOLA|nr:hypothetical protein K7X08_027787 [Anisodus acutangulus]